MHQNRETGADGKVNGQNDSSKRAHELRLDSFGTPEEVREMAKTERNVYTRGEARIILRAIVNQPLTSKAGIEATLSNNAIEKILSGKAVDKSFESKAHFLAVANLDKLFSQAIEPFNFPFDPSKSNENYRAVRRLYAPMAYKENIILVKFTVMEMRNETEGKRIYSLEAINVDLKKN
jgi:hypothetical protein